MNMKRILSAIGLLAVAAPATLSVVACGSKEEAKTDLKTIIDSTTIDGNQANDKTSVFQEILKLHENKGLKEQDIEIKDFIAADYTNDGSTTIIATTQSKFTGEVAIKITKLAQTELNNVLKNTTVDGENANTDTTVLKELIKLNSENNLTEQDFEIKDFKAATKLDSGSAKAIAKPNTKFTGSVDITITALPKDKLSEAITNTTVDSTVTRETIIDKILELNANSNVKKADLSVTDFKAPEINKTGSAIIEATKDSTFIGSVDITITAIPKDALTDVIKITEVASVTEGNIIEEVLKNNSGSSLTKNELEVTSFKAATLEQAGSAIISAKSESKFTGSVEITIVALNDSDYYNKLIEGLKNAETKSQEKLDLWIKFFNYKHYQTKAMVENGLITAELTKEDDFSFFTWIINSFMWNIRNELKQLGIDTDYKGYQFEPGRLQYSIDKEKKIATVSGTFYLTSWDDTKVLFHTVDKWQVPYIVVS